jgi:hypothetical protein
MYERAGRAAEQWITDTGDCLFCDSRSAGGKHESHCEFSRQPKPVPSRAELIMNPTALQILRAALEKIAEPMKDWHHGRLERDITLARAALEAAAKAPSLADHVVAMAHAYEAVLDHVDNRPEAADACARDVLRALDAYQRRTP